MIWPALRAAVDAVIWTLEAAGTVYDAGARLVRKVKGTKQTPAAPAPGLSWLDVQRQQQQAKSAAHAFPPKSSPPPTK